MIIKFVDQSEFLWMTTQETSVCPQCTGRGAAFPVVAASGKPIMAFNWDFNCVWWSKSIDYKTGGIWVHTCVFCVSICVAHQILLLSWPVNGFSWNQSTMWNHRRHDLHDISISLEDDSWLLKLFMCVLTRHLRVSIWEYAFGFSRFTMTPV